MNCIPEGVLRAYVDHELEPAEVALVETHLRECSPCQTHAAELSAARLRVGERLGALEESPRSLGEDNPQIALSRFKANLPLPSGPQEPAGDSLRVGMFAGQRRFAWAAAVAAAILLMSLAFPSARSFAQRLLSTLRIEKVQTVALDLSSFDGVPSNSKIQEAISQMISDNVVVTTNEKPLPASTKQDASSLAGFPVRLPAARTDAPQFHVEGAHAFHMTVDRARLQDILDQAGRTDLILPASLEGASVSVQIPRSVETAYGNCPQHQRNSAGSSSSSSSSSQSQQPAPTPAIPSNCVFFMQAPSPLVNVPSDLNLQQLAETALQFVGMSPTQAREFCQTVDWRSTLVLPIPPSVRSYETVTVDGVQGTLMNTSNRHGPGGSSTGYALVWVKSGIIYALFGSGDSSAAVQLANSLD
jgi:hypothetical protein